ncbi:putative phosphoglycerate mutase family protein [Neospora caninum Liverpool]|uniref:Putative phosphoglycerate mutase family protein n=1 Tax=Neospora caninum (strain Liverpool) TaxID=572307 RepID=F0V8I3_NEOCL|nr:putative phosphoglycerate mutase family protein [Neospora caninum Liverpool]CBZ50024.1 putative phosphoglycerate mutase family protein [Neospora caninum Liverpool]|eukprot:XP_003880059.1 putative phosphoglycerate mutase family protein [Neospora caninum Liverpool]
MKGLLGLRRHSAAQDLGPSKTSSLRLILIRHAESTNNALFQRLRDEVLSSTRADPLLNLEELFEAQREVGEILTSVSVLGEPPARLLFASLLSQRVHSLSRKLSLPLNEHSDITRPSLCASDPGLSARGHTQARLLGSHFFENYLRDALEPPSAVAASVTALPATPARDSDAESPASLSFPLGSRSDSSVSAATGATSANEEETEEAEEAELSRLSSANGTGALSPHNEACAARAEEEPGGEREEDDRPLAAQPPVEGIVRRSGCLKEMGKKMEPTETERRKDEQGHKADGRRKGSGGGDGRKEGGRRQRVIVSPLLRTILTALPLLDNLNLKRSDCVLDPDLYEVGGLYKVCRSAGGEPPACVAYPGCTKREYEERFPGRLCAPEGIENGWYNPERGKEGLAEARARAHRVAESFWRMAETAEAEGLRTVVVVSHAHFLELLMKALCQPVEGEAPPSSFAFSSPFLRRNPPPDGVQTARVHEDAKIHANFLFHNTGVSCIRLVASQQTPPPEPSALLKPQWCLTASHAPPAKSSRFVVVEWMNRLDHLDGLHLKSSVDSVCLNGSSQSFAAYPVSLFFRQFIVLLEGVSPTETSRSEEPCSIAAFLVSP